MGYVEILPRAELRPFINCFWTYQGDRSISVNDCTFPDGCIEIIFNLQTDVFRSSNNIDFSRNSPVELIGQMTAPYYVRFSGLNRFLGVRFFPHTFSCFTLIPPYELNDLSVDSSDVLSVEFNRIARTINAEEETSIQIAALENFFLKKLNSRTNDSKHKLLEQGIRLVYQKHIGSMQRLAFELAVEERSLQRLFKERVGISPKLFIKIARFQKVFRHLNCAFVNLTNIGYQCGYFDQAHFIRDFRSLSGTTPSQYLATAYPINKHFLSENTNAYLFGMTDSKTL